MRKVIIELLAGRCHDVYIEDNALPFDGIGCFLVYTYADDSAKLVSPSGSVVCETASIEQMLEALQNASIDRLCEMFND